MVDAAMQQLADRVSKDYVSLCYVTAILTLTKATTCSRELVTRVVKLVPASTWHYQVKHPTPLEDYILFLGDLKIEHDVAIRQGKKLDCREDLYYP